MVSSPYDAPSTLSLTWSIFLAGRNCKTAYLGCWKLRASFTPHPFFEEPSNCYILTLVTVIGKLQLHSHQTLTSYRRTCSQRDLWGDFSVVQWLRICFAKKEKKNLSCEAGVMGSIPGWGTKIPRATKPVCCNRESNHRKERSGSCD